MTDTTDKTKSLIASLAKRSDRKSKFGYGIWTADRYVRTLAERAGMESCGIFLQGNSFDSLLQKAAGTLTYTNEDMLTEVKQSARDFADIVPDGVDLPKNTLIVFKHVLTTPQKDRDGDILRTEGAELDPKMLLLWQHIHTLPIGKMLAIAEHNNKVLSLISAVVDMNELAHDAAVMIDNDMGRFSHGFRAFEFEEMKAEDGEAPGFDVKRFEIMEESLVSVPSNIAAETEEVLLSLVDQKRLKSRIMKSVAGKIREKRPTVVGGTQMRLKIGDAEIEIKSHERAAPSQVLKDDTKKTVVETKVVNDSTSHLPQRKTCQAVVKAFDVYRETVEPDKIEYDWAARFLGCGVKDIYVVSTTAGGAMRGSVMLGYEELTKDWTIQDTRNLSSSGTEYPPEYERVQLNSKRTETFLTEGLRFYDRPDGIKVVIGTGVTWHGQQYYMYVERKHADKVTILDDMWEWATENHQMKGEAFSLTGDFIVRTGTKWSDLFLPVDTESILTRTVRLINQKGSSLANRGLILQGPPGTGKTLSGRVMLNEAKATFVWLSAKDFWRTGAIGGLAGAFSLAKLLSPSILFIEDVDNWMSDHAVDYLKTEMDGIARSTGVVTMLTTNYPEALPDTLIDRPGRFHDVIEFGLPDKSVRERMIKAWVADIDDMTATAIAKKTEGYSGAHLYELAYFAQTLRDEDDDMSVADSLEKALSKIAEQRTKIDQNQLAGSNYRPSRRDGPVVSKAIKFARQHEDSQDAPPELTVAEMASRVFTSGDTDLLKNLHSMLSAVFKSEESHRKGEEYRALIRS